MQTTPTQSVKELPDQLKADLSGAIARAYCYVENSRKKIDHDLLKAMAIELEKVVYSAIEAEREFTNERLRVLLSRIYRGHYGTKNRAELISSLTALINENFDYEAELKNPFKPNESKQEGKL